jgi:hypothetical protein
MSFASDVQAKTLTATGTAVNGRSRVQGVYFVNTGTADTITIKNGSTGATVMTIPTPPVAGAHDLLIPDNGILCADEIYVSFDNAKVTSVTVLFVGGAAA